MKYGPSGRTNHYWFDLNRDWLPAQHPESSGRLKIFHQWRPNVLTDHHEMGTNSTFFFQPGIPSRTHPLTPKKNQTLTKELTQFHADLFDKRKELYFTQEVFDDFYYGKGSTYPDINGAIGILFEQASSRGHAQQSDHGILRFPQTIRNQVQASLATLSSSHHKRIALLEYQQEFYKNALKMSKDKPYKAYVFGHPKDQGRTYNLVRLLKKHHINVYHLAKTVENSSGYFAPNQSFIIPIQQRQFRLIEALFDQRTHFNDSLFYDISTWNLFDAFHMPHTKLRTRNINPFLGESIDNPNHKAQPIPPSNAYAYAFQWHEYYTPRALYRLLKKGVKAKVTDSPLIITGQNNEQTSLDRGSIIIPIGIQSVNKKTLSDLWEKIVIDDGIKIHAIASGLTKQGADIGSRSFSTLNLPSVAMVVGPGVNSYEAGEVWHLLDTRYHIPLSMIGTHSFASTQLKHYTHLIMVSGNYHSMGEREIKKINQWINSGGILIAVKSSLQWLHKKKIISINWKENKNEEKVNIRPYTSISDDYGSQYIGGAIFTATADITHPLLYGYTTQNFPVFRNSTLFIEENENSYATPLRYTSSPLRSGYISSKNKNQLKNSTAITVYRKGSGRIVALVDNPNFRGFWYGTNKLFANALFFSSHISFAATH